MDSTNFDYYSKPSEPQKEKWPLTPFRHQSRPFRPRENVRAQNSNNNNNKTSKYSPKSPNSPTKLTYDGPPFKIQQNLSKLTTENEVSLYP